MQNWTPIDDKELARLRDRGGITQNAQGLDGIRVTLRSAHELESGQTREQWRAELECWIQEVAVALQPWGGEVDAQTLSLTGQTVEAWLPVASLDTAARKMAEENCRMDIVVSRRLTL